MANVRLIVFSLVACSLGGCASSNLYTGADAGMHRFNQVGGAAVARASNPRPAPRPSTQAAQTAAAAPAPAPPPVQPTAPAPTAPSSVEAAPAAPAGRLAAAAPPPARAVIGSAALDQARSRVIALLSAEGFAPESDASAEVISASRMATANDDVRDAVCGVRALNRPRMYAANVDVRLAPGAQGIEVGVDAHFEEMDQNLVSGELSKHACASRGVLEAQVRRAATGG